MHLSINTCTEKKKSLIQMHILQNPSGSLVQLLLQYSMGKTCVSSWAFSEIKIVNITHLLTSYVLTSNKKQKSAVLFNYNNYVDGNNKIP